ncbi:MAG: hypothetical protein ACHP79_14210 [Terriglobales bacterium]
MPNQKKDEQRKDKQDKDEKLDAMLDSLLSTYSSAEPRPGLETRILANLQEATAKKSLGWNRNWIWAGAAAAAAAAILLAVYFSRPAPQAPQVVVTPPAPQIVAPTHTPPQESARQESTSQESTREAQPRAPHRQRSPEVLVADVRQDVFPSPSPLSEQEKLLFSYLRATPREELVAQSHPDEPPAEASPQDQSALPARGSTNQPSNTR